MQPETLTGELAESFATAIQAVDESIGENKNYGEGIGPHDEDDQVDALVDHVQSCGTFDPTVPTAKSDPSKVRYGSGQSADLVITTPDETEFCEAKLLRFLKANGNPSPYGFSKVFSPFQDRNPRSLIHDVQKLASADVRVAKTFLGIYYRPVEQAGSEFDGRMVARAFASAVDRWSPHELTVDTVADFSGLQHDVLSRGSVIVWRLSDQPDQYF